MITKICLVNPAAHDTLESLAQAVIASNEMVIAAMRTMASANRNVLDLLQTLVELNDKGRTGEIQAMLADVTFFSQQFKQPTKH